MKHRILLALAALSFSAVLSACGDTVTQPQAHDAQASAVAYEPIDPVDPCTYNTYSGTESGVYSDCNPDPCPDCYPCPDCPTQPTIPPFDPPPAPYTTADVPLIYGGFNWQTQSCNQIAHVKIAFSNDVPQGTTLYVGGVVVRGAYSNIYFYDVNGNLVKTKYTQRARDNCVIHHEPEAFSTWDLAPGYYYVYASYWSLTNYGYESTYGWPTGITGRHIATIRIR